MVALPLIIGLIAGVGSASALTLGVGWSGNPSLNEPEMLQVGKSGASTFRVTMPPENNNDGIVKAAAENGVTIHAGLNGGGPLPSGSARTTFISQVRNEVKRYGYSGEFWAANPGLPYKPITTWEVWNESNSLGIAPAEYGVFLSEVASAIQAASNERAGRGTDVLFGGLLAMGNLGKTFGTWQERGPVTYMGALQYLQEAYPYIKSSSNVTGVAIHPYELDPETFYQPAGKPRYNRIEAFKYAVSGFHTKLVELGASAQKSLWITEAGWPAEGPRYSVGATEQATLLSQAIDYAKNNEATLNLKDFLWYNIHDRPGNTVWDDFCGLRAHDDSYRPSWVSFQGETGAASWPAPTAVTGAATLVQASQATLNGSVNPNARQTSYTFEYGPTTAYGHAVPVPSGNAGSGGSVVTESATAVGLLSEMTYHYRIAASNAAGTTFGEDHTFTTADPGLAHSWAVREPASGTQWLYYAKAGSGLIQGGWNGASWNSGTIGGTVAIGSTPAITRDPATGNQWAYYVNGSGSLAQWAWNGSSWSSGTFAGSVAANSSPSAVSDPASGNQWVYYVNGSGSLAQWAWNGSSWGSGTFAGSVRAGTSPAAIRAPGAGTQWVYYVNGSGAIALWGWNGSSWESGTIGGSVAPNSSPAVEWDPNTGTQWVYYVNSTGALAEWSWNGSAWSGGVIGGSAAAGTSPAVVQDQATKTTWVYYVNGSGGISQMAWDGSKWSSGTLGAFGGNVKAGTSPVAIRDPNTGNQWVYYLNATGGITQWAWNGSKWSGGIL
jgi:hypothetical protein